MSSQIPPWINEKILRGETILFLGSGASFGSRGRNGEKPLSGDQLRDRLSDKFLGGSHKSNSLAQVAEFAKSESSLFDVQKFVSELLEPLEPASFHQLIPEFRWHAIITTNYDHLIERAYQNVQKPQQLLGRVVRDGVNFGEVISSLRKVPFLKLHGCLSVINDPELPLILSTEEYARFRKNREHLFSQFSDWSKEYPVIFCGYDLADPNVQQVLYDIGDASVNRTPFLMVKPGLSAFECRYWQSRRVVPINQSFDEFLRQLDSDLPASKRSLGALVGSNDTSIQKWVARGRPSETLCVYLERELEHICIDLISKGVEPRDFYRGENNSWDALRRNLDIRRRIADDIQIEAILDASSSPVTEVRLVKGHAGSGKSICLRRAAWDAATEHRAFVLFLKNGGLVRTELVRELCMLTNDRVFLFIEDAMRHLEELNLLVSEAKRSHLRLSIVMGARTNEWNVAGDQFQFGIDSEYELRGLSNSEIDELLIKLKQHDCMFWLSSLPHEAQVQHFVLTADRQLLVALHEATLGKPFEEIVFDEYQKLVPSEAKVLYADICTLHRFNVGVRAGLISRISGVTLSLFQDRLLAPLEHVVHVYMDGASRDYAYRTRHPLVAEWVFRQAFKEQEDRAGQIVRIIGAMNTEYTADSKAFEQLVRGRDLAELFSNRLLADRVFEAALKSSASVSHVEHQRAVFELNHPGGSIDRAIKALDVALEHSTPGNQAILHTKAMALRKKALESDSGLVRQKYRIDAKKILERQVQLGNRSYAFSSMGQLLFDELTDEIADSENPNEMSALKERAISEKLAEIERILKTGLQRFPGDPYLLGLEANLAGALKDSPRALLALRKAHQGNPANEHTAVRLSKLFQQSVDPEEARNTLLRCIEANPMAKLARLEFAKILIEEGEQANRDQIRSLLRSSFTDGDSNLDSHFWFARHEFLYGDQENSKRIFDSLAKSKVPVAIKNRWRGTLQLEDGQPKTFDGVISSVRDTYCFVNIPVLQRDVFAHHNDCRVSEWSSIHVGTRVSVVLTFTFRGAQGVQLKIRSNT